MTKQWIAAIAVGLVTLSAVAQDTNQSQTEFKPSGKLDGRIFSDFYTTVAGPVNESAFELKRAYLGYSYALSPEWSARVLLDIGDKDGMSRYAFFKNAALYYTHTNWKIGFGIQDTYSLKTQEKLWGKRYIEKSYLDYYKLAHTADLGVSAQYTVGKFSFDAGVFNGEGYKTVQKDNTYRASIGATAVLLNEQLILRIGDEYEKKYIAQNTATFFAGYKGKILSGGVEYNQQTNYALADGTDRGGISVFATLKASEKVSVFGRYEEMATSDNIIFDNDGVRYIAGIEYKVLKNLRGALNLQGFEPESAAESTAAAYVSIEVVF